MELVNPAFHVVQASTVFDPVWYLRRYPEVHNFGDGPLAHFCLRGQQEMRDPSPSISLSKYFRRAPNAQTASLPDFVKGLTQLSSEDREAILPEDDLSLEYLVGQLGLFDHAWYIMQNEDVRKSGGNPLEHFLRHGIVEGRNPSALFDTQFYRNAYPEYVEQSRTPFEHFVRIGKQRGHAGVGRAPYQRWLEFFDALTEADVDRIREAALVHPVVAFHIIDDDAVPHAHRIIEAWSGQIGSTVDVRFLRGFNLSDKAWSEVAARIEKRPNFRFDGRLECLGELPPSAIVVICAGAVIVRPHAAYVLGSILAQSGARAVYADHDHIDAAGIRTRPVFKPAMSPLLMRSSQYAGAVIATVMEPRYRERLRTTIEAAQRGNANGALALYLLDLPTESVARAPFVAFSVLGTGCPTVARSKPDLREVGEIGTAPRVRVSIIIATRDRSELLNSCLDSIEAETDYPAELIDFVIVDNESKDPAALSYLAALAKKSSVTVVRSLGSFNFAKLCNEGAAPALGDVLVFLNNDVLVNKRDWLKQLVSRACEPDIGMVGAHLLYPDGTVQHGGVVLGVQGVAAHRFKGLDDGGASAVDLTREIVTVTGACLATRREVFQALGGFDPALRVAFNDVDLCAKSHKAGYRNVYIGDPLLYHLESKSRGFDDTRAKKLRNAREAIYARERHGSLFQNDPSYSPNLSLQAVDDLATPPRVIRPWRQSLPGRKRILFLSYEHRKGHGVATVLEQQAPFFLQREWDVIIGGPTRARDLPYDGCRRVNLWTAEAAASYAVSEGIDCIVAHTPPFFSITRYLADVPLVYFMDHGEPPPKLFAEAEEREDINWEKRFCAPLARRVFTVSETINQSQSRRDAVVIRNGNSHLSTWSKDWADKRQALRAKFGFEDCFVVLNVCRFGPGERVYKGINTYGEIASDVIFTDPGLSVGARFVLAGRGNLDDVNEVQQRGLTAYANVSDEELIELYVASDLYMSLSEWEGYNLGIGQALAMGLDVIASDIGAHREFGIETFDSVPEFCAAVVRYYADWKEEQTPPRQARIESWDVPLMLMATMIEADVASRPSFNPATVFYNQAARDSMAYETLELESETR